MIHNANVMLSFLFLIHSLELCQWCAFLGGTYQSIVCFLSLALLNPFAYWHSCTCWSFHQAKALSWSLHFCCSCYRQCLCNGFWFGVGTRERYRQGNFCSSSVCSLWLGANVGLTSFFFPKSILNEGFGYGSHLCSMGLPGFYVCHWTLFNWFLQMLWLGSYLFMYKANLWSDTQNCSWCWYHCECLTS